MVRDGGLGEFQQIRQDVLLQFMDIVEGAGSSFAFPRTTVHLASAPIPFVTGTIGSELPAAHRE